MSHLNHKLCKASGNVVMKGRLEAFLYGLMRDTVPCGEVQRLVDDATQGEIECQFTNGYLAQYAKFLADQLCEED